MPYLSSSDREVGTTLNGNGHLIPWIDANKLAVSLLFDKWTAS